MYIRTRKTVLTHVVGHIILIALVLGCGGGSGGRSGSDEAAAADAPVAMTGSAPDFFQQTVEGAGGGEGIVMQFGGPPDNVVRIVARTLNASEHEIRREWSEQPLAEVARAYNVEPSVVAEALKTDEHARLLREAAAGRLPPNAVEQMRGMFAKVVDTWLALPLQATVPDAPQLAPLPADAPARRAR